MKASRQTITMLALLGVFVLCSMTTLVQAAPPRGDGARHHRPGHFIHIIDLLLDLDLTVEQKNDMQAIFSDARETLTPLLKDTHELRSAIEETMLGENIDAAKASLQIQEMSRLKAQITTVCLNAMLRTAQVLTPEQRQTISETRNEWKRCVMRLHTMLLRLFGDGSAE